MNHEVLLLILAAFVAYSLVSRKIEQSILTLPMLLMGVGCVLSGALHANSVEYSQIETNSQAVEAYRRR